LLLYNNPDDLIIKQVKPLSLRTPKDSERNFNAICLCGMSIFLLLTSQKSNPFGSFPLTNGGFPISKSNFLFLKDVHSKKSEWIKFFTVKSSNFNSVNIFSGLNSLHKAKLKLKEANL